MGYGESKYVAELLLEAGADKCGVPAVICRVGQLGGPVTKEKGMWTKQEWLPSVSLRPSLIIPHQAIGAGKLGMAMVISITS